MTDDDFMELLVRAAFGEYPSMGAIDFLIEIAKATIAKVEEAE